MHLLWEPMGPELLRRFLDSYRRQPAAADHDLLIVYNGFAPGQDLGPWRSELQGVSHEELRLPAPVIDLQAYREVAERAPAERYCFLNSASIIQADGWLDYLEAALAKPGTGLAGATGSWASIRSLTRVDRGLRGPYSKVFEDRRAVREQLTLLTAQRQAATPVRGPERWLAGKLRAARDVVEHMRGFAEFPSPHLRTNGYLVDREVWLAASGTRRVSDKIEAYRLESGRESLTRRVERLGLEVVVVARDGCAFAPADWPGSDTFWQAGEEKLLIADNQTESYLHGSDELRRFLSGYAWGERAAPAPVTSARRSLAGS